MIFAVVIAAFISCFGSSVNRILDVEDHIIKHLPENSKKIITKGTSFFTEDLDGVGNKEIIVPYKDNDIENAVFLLVIKYDENNSLSYKLKGDGGSIERLEFRDINCDNKKDILLGTQIGSELYRLNVFDYDNGKFTKEFTYSYSRFYLLENIVDNTNANCAMAFWNRAEEGCYKVEVVRWNGSELVEAVDLRKSYFSKVVDFYKESSLKEKNNAFLWYYLADAQIKAGHKKEAFISISNGVALNKERPTKQEFDELKRKIKQ